MTNIKSKKSSWVSNEEADKIVLTVQNAIKSNKVDHEAQRKLMDLVSTVDNYSLTNIYKQGVISKIFDKEKFRSYDGKNISNHFGYDINDIISIFWEEVFKSLPKAEARGADVSVRNMDGDSQFKIRKTNCNPIYYLRNRGIMAVRNVLNDSYRTNIKQVCNSCGTQSALTTVENKSYECPNCGSSNTVKYWPDGNSSYMSKKGRKCNDCSHTWARKFSRACYKCGSTDIYTDSKIVSQEDIILYVPADISSAEMMVIDTQDNANLDILLHDIRDSLPIDPENPDVDTKTKEVFNLLVFPEASQEMCKQCHTNAAKVCEKKCNLFKLNKLCEHNLVPDSSSCCGETSFNPKCINYSKKIGEYQHCSASLAARRVKASRRYTLKYIREHRDNELCKSLYGLINKYDL